LNVVRVEIPALRERREDIPLLVHHFLRKHGGALSRIEGIEEGALDRLIASDWPGNVRQLENTIESAMALAPGPRLRATDLTFGRPLSRPVSAPTLVALPITLEAYERCALERALATSAGDATAAARLLGIGRSTFYRKLAKHSLHPGNRPARTGDRGQAARRSSEGVQSPRRVAVQRPRFEDD
jgi:DNA-binding NtrC family response regulator